MLHNFCSCFLYMLYAIIYSTCIYVETFSNISLLKSLTAKKCSPLLWNVLENILDPKKKSPPDGDLLELKKGGELCNCRELVIIIIFKGPKL